MRVAQRSLMPTQGAHQGERYASMRGASRVERFFRERLDARGLGVGVLWPVRTQADLLELDAELHSLRVG